jgi:hypothetical protein
MADFEVPSKPTVIAQVATAVATVTLDLADAMTSVGNTAMALTKVVRICRSRS